MDHNNSKIKLKIGIMSGKGGVGKSTVTSLLASSLKKSGYTVGVFDADITGSSIARMFGVMDEPESKDEMIIPPESNGIKIISMNLFLEEESLPVMWRGPLITNTIRQFLSDVLWGELDILLIDFPPGTSDAPLTLMQSKFVDYVLFVTSPQDLSSMIVEKAIKMTERLGIPSIGIVENMYGVECPYCHKFIEIFGSSKARKLEEKYGIPIMSRIPIDRKLSELSDSGEIYSYDCKCMDDLINRIKSLIEKA